MAKTLGIKGLFTIIFLIFLFAADFARADGYFRLILIDGTVAEGEMIRITPATIEIDPEGPEKFASYNRGKIREILYMKQKPGSTAGIESARDREKKPVANGILVVRFDVEKDPKPDDTIVLVHDYVMIDGKLYLAGWFEDFLIELPSGNHTLELCGIDMAYYEPSDFYSLENGGTCPRIWRQDNPFAFGSSMNIEVRGDSATIITLEKRNRDYLFVSDQKSHIDSRADFLLSNQGKLRELSLENGIIPGKLVFEELPKNRVLHDSLEYRYAFVFNQSERARFNNAAYLPGHYEIEARAVTWNKWKNKPMGQTVNRFEVELKSGHTTVVKFEFDIGALNCQVAILPERWFEISARESQD